MLTLATTSPLQDHLEAEFIRATTMEPSSAAPAGRRTWSMEIGGSGSEKYPTKRKRKGKTNKPPKLKGGGGGGGGVFL